MYCPFCDIEHAKDKIIHKGEHAYVILSNPHLMKGHMLVIPYRHVEKLSELEEKEKKELWHMVEEFEEKILENLAKGCDIRQNYRPFQKQDGLKVNHLHIHLHPRELYDDLYKKCQKHEKDVFSKLSEEEISEVVQKLKL